MQPTERLHALDAVRAFALLCGVLLHASLSFLPGLPPFVISPASDPAKSTGLAVMFFCIHLFRMTSFFLIAGVFARMMLHRKGTWGFIKNRLLRIVVPLLVGWPLVMASILGLWLLGLSLAFHGVAPPKPPAAPATHVLLPFPLTHLWFLYILIWLYAAALLLRGVVAGVIDRRGGLRGRIDALVRGLVGSPLAVLVLGVPTAAALHLAPVWDMWFGVPTPDSSLIPQPGSIAIFGLAFGLGWLLQRQLDLLQVLARRWAFHLVLTAALIAGCLALAGVTPQLAPSPDGPRKLAFAALYGMAIWSSTFTVIGGAVRFLTRANPAIRYLADASYWIYLIHLPLVYLLQIAVSQLDWPAPAKFAAILAVALPLMLASYQLLVRYSFIGRVLNGRRRRPQRGEVAPAPQPA